MSYNKDFGAYRVIDLGISRYEDVYALQKELVAKRKLGIIKDTVIITEHLPVFTIGRNGLKENLLEDMATMDRLGVRLVEADRGGDVTFHGIGQLILYPIIDLRYYKKDLHLYMRMLEEIMINLLNNYSIEGKRRIGATGVWLDRHTKIGSIGIGVSKWVTYHGLSININTNLDYFNMIIPCGLKFAKMSSVCDVLGGAVDMNEAKAFLLSGLDRVLKIYGEIPGLVKKDLAPVGCIQAA